MATNVINGKIIVKETGVGIRDLIVVIHDLDPGTLSEDAAPPRDRVSPAADVGGLGDRLGSRLTDANGLFNFSFEDGEFQLRNPKERRPDLQLSVLAPEEPGLDPAKRLLFTSKDVRFDAGRVEEYLIRLPRDLLLKAGIEVPSSEDFSGAHAADVSKKLQKVSAWRKEVAKEVRRMATEKVTAARAEAKKADSVVREKMLDRLTGMTAAEAAKANVVRPGQDSARTVWNVAKKRLAKVNANGGMVGYLVLTEEEAAPFREGAGWRSDVPSSEIEPYLFRANEADARPTTITRADPLDALCRPAGKANPILTPEVGSTDGNGSGGGVASATPLPEVEATLLDIPRFVGRVINDMVSPEHPKLTDPFQPSAADIGKSLEELKIAGGPADVTAFHDYSNLQIAFDYVWAQIVDEDALEAASALSRRISEAGGDATTAIAAGQDPVEALRGETRIIARLKNDPDFGGPLPEWVNGIDDGGLWDPTDPGGWGGGGGGSGGGGSGGGGGGKRNLGEAGPRATDMSVDQSRPPHEILGTLEEILNEKYSFDVFAPGSTNFGLLVGYRQRWKPVTYQAGDLVHTVTLAPRESRKVSAKRTVKRERSQKETEANLRNRSDESKSTSRADAEVVDRASTKSSFNLNAKGTYNIGIAKGDASTTLDRGAEASSQETKKSFHEDVMNAAMQLRSEKNWSFESKDSEEVETTDTSEITNPNDELTVTYLYYELERRYLVTEHLHRLTPVVLVAMEVPNPNRKSIDKVLLKHSWIINRVLLDDRYRAPLEYLTNRIVGDELGLQEMVRNLAEIRAAVEVLKKMQRDVEAEVKAREAVLDLAIRQRAVRAAEANGGGVVENTFEWAFGKGDEEDIESARIVEDMRREELERSARREKDVRMRLDAETANLNGAHREYAQAYAEHMNRVTEVASLRAHFKENVLYYMQAIWAHTFKDQLFFSLYKIKAPRITETQKRYDLSAVDVPPPSIALQPGRIVLKVTADYTLESDISVENDAVTLAEIADLDQPLGFKGNYMIFPLRKSNPLVDLMMVPYVDTELGLHDPDALGAWSPEDFACYARCLLEKHRAAGDLDEVGYQQLQDRLVAQYEEILTSPRRVSDEIVVPTSSLFIEALPGEHALLEQYKRDHRLMDLEKTREEARKLKLEALRYAARVLDKRYDDPDVERQIVVAGANGSFVVPTDP
ncbi:MAG TPA: hypothetical protein VHP33_10970 [Polyangiaceae bacterium]|nr:hypothetical protein [Polyangiaceae bacterium]